MGSVVSTALKPVGSILGSVTGALGGPGSQYQAAPAAVRSPVTDAQAQAAQQASLDALQQQKGLASELANQGGLGTQNNVLAQQQALANQLQGTAASQTGVQNQSNILAQQQALANQLQNQAAGQGPNPAQQQYQQNINAGTQAAAGTIASEKGISPALMAEMIARQQGSASQNAAGTAATLQAQQQLAAQQALQSQQAGMQGVASNQVGQQQLAAQQLQNQQAQLQGVAGSQIGQQVAGQTALTGATQNQQQALLGNITGVNQSNVNAQNAAMQTNASTAAANAARQSQMMGGLLQAGGAIGGAMIGGPAGAVAGSVIGGGLANSSAGGGTANSAGRTSVATGGMIKNGGGLIIPEHLQHVSDIYHGPKEKMAEGGEINYSKKESTDIKLPENKMVQGGYSAYQSSSLVPGKAKVDHDSYSNDTVKALLSPGEVVLDLDVMNSKNPPEEAKNFVQALLNEKAKNSNKDKDAFHSALKTAISKRKK